MKKNFIKQPNNNIIFYSEINNYLIGSNIFYNKLKINNNIIMKNTCISVFLYNDLFIQFSLYFSNKVIKYIMSFLLLQIKNSYFGKTIRFRINGRGYRLFSQLNHILFKLGYSHVINFTLPLQYEIQKKEKNQSFFKIITIGLINADTILAEIKTLRSPNVYSKKGIFKKNDIVVFKEGKKNFTL